MDSVGNKITERLAEADRNRATGSALLIPHGVAALWHCYLDARATGKFGRAIMAFFAKFLYSQLFVTPAYPTHDFSGKTVVITGANVGLGLEAARHIARLNCQKLVVGVRSISKGQKAKESILASTRRADDNIEVWELDLGQASSVQAFARRIQTLERVDVVIENAALGVSEWNVLEGYESVVKVNVISTLQLALHVLPKLRETAAKFSTETHLTIVTSEAHEIVRFPARNAPNIYAELNERKSFDRIDR